MGSEVHVTCDGCGAEAVVGPATERWVVLLVGRLDERGLPADPVAATHLCDRQCRARWHERQARTELARA